MKTLFVSLLFVITTQISFAQETQDTFHLDQMVVSATRLPQPMSTVPLAVSVMGSAEFNRLGLRNVADVLRTVSGAALVQGGSYGALSSLFLRGGESDYVQVLLDGVQINSPGEFFDYSALSLDNIERVEVVKGPASVLYGSDAVAGVVQLFSKRGAERTRAQVTALAGRGSKVGASARGEFDSIDLRADVNGGQPALNYSVGLSHFGTEGALAYNNAHRLTSITARLAGQPGQRIDASLSGRVTRNRFHYPTDGSGNLIDANQFHEADALAIGMDAGYRLHERTELRLQLAVSRNQDHIDDAPDSPADTSGFYGFISDDDFQRRSVELRVNQQFGRSTILTLGGEVEDQAREAESVSASSFGEFASASDDERSNRAGFAQLLTEKGALTLQGGVRLDHNQPFGDFFTYRTAVGLRLGDHLRLRASLGTGFKEPRFFEQFSESVGARGNRLLTPEQSRSTEVGADFTVGIWSAGVTAFRQAFRDLIQYTFAPVTPDSVNYVNVGRVASDGIELESRITMRSWALHGSLTLLSTRVEDAGAGNDPLYQSGARLIRRPGQSASVAAQYGHTFSIGAVLSYVGPRADLYYDESFTPVRVTLPSYTKLDVIGRSPAFRGARALLKIENVLNDGYEEIRNFPARERVVFVGFALDR